MYTNISILNRYFRVVMSLGLVFALFGMSGPLGAAVALPFVSIYAGITGFIGWDPAIAVMNILHSKVSAKQGDVHHDAGLAAH